MRLAWYTPYSQRSAIGLASKEIVSSLLDLGHQVTIVRSESLDSDWSKTSREPICEVITAASIDAQLKSYLRDFDSVIYNVGNHLPNHLYCLKHQPLVPGITLLHDYILHNLLIDWLNANDSHSYLDALGAEAGDEAVEQYHAASDDLSRKWFMSKSAEFPVLRFAMARTLGVVTHAEFYAAPCRTRLSCPVTTIPLAFSCAREEELESPVFNAKPLRLITIGDVNVNKRCESVIQAIGESRELSTAWQYRIVGNVSKPYRQHLLNLARNGKYPVDVVLLGKVCDETLQRELHDSHAIACLRFPIIEGASASVIISLASGRPTLVSNGGCYGEIPDEYIYRVRQASECDDIGIHLKHIACNSEQAVTKASQARSWAVPRHSGLQYAKALLAFIETVVEAQPMLQLADVVSNHLANWNCRPSLSIIDRIESESISVFGDIEA